MAQNTSGQKLIVIVGPTASGKSDLGIKLAKKYNGEIISADSRQVYKGMDIGTGKVTKKEQKIVKHYLLDVVSPKRRFTADDFKKLGEKAIDTILAKGKIPIITGGTGFYIDILLNRMQTAQVPPNIKLRAKLSRFALRFAQLANRGSSISQRNSSGISKKSGRNLEAEALFRLLKKIDPERAKTIDHQNKRRLVRAIEIVVLTGKPVPNSRFNILNSRFNILWLGLKPKNLEKRIKKRLEERLKQGMIKEVKKLQDQGVSWQRLDDLGLEYRWISRWLIQNEKIKMQNDNLKLESFKKTGYYEKLLREIIKYSKRQMTWFKRNKNIAWIKNKKATDKLVATFLKVPLH